MNFFITIIFFILHFSSTIARIFSSNQDTQSPTLLTHFKEQNIFYERFQRFLERRKRQTKKDTPNEGTELPPIMSAASELGNETMHNQALIHWSGNYSSVIFILTRRKDMSLGGTVTHSDLWRSTDYGLQYVKESYKFLPDASLNSYYTCPNNKSKVLFIDSYRNGEVKSRVWSSIDEGESYVYYNLSFNLDRISFHPNQQDVVLGYDKKDATLYASMDLAKTWSKLQEGVTEDRYYWYKKGLDESEYVVFMEYQDLSVFERPFYLVKTCTVPDCARTSFQNKCNALGPIEKKSLLVQDDYIFAQKSGALEKLFVSYKRSEFVRASFHDNTEQMDIHVVSSHSNTVVVGVNHDDGVTNLYFSDERGQEYAFSLEDVRYFNKQNGPEEIFTVDIHEVKGVKGVYLANKKIHGLLNRTMITWDNGRVWQPLAPPAGDRCDGCKLNLHCAMSRTKSGYYIPAMMSKESAPGVIIAHGSASKTLIDTPGLTWVFVSNDTGRTWQKAMRGRNLYVIGDHGSIILAVSMHFLKPVSTLSLSKDFGVSWNEYNFSSDFLFVDGILTEPGENTHQFTLFGHETHQGSWKVYSIDVSRAIHRKCNYPDDFRNVTLPFDGTAPCHLGMNRQSEVVSKRDCLIGKSFRRKFTVQRCNCTDDDYECGFGYYRSSLKDKDCAKLHPHIDWIDDSIDSSDFFLFFSSPCIDGYKNVTTRYRKIPGDVCINDVPDKLYRTEKCVSTETPPTTTSITFPPFTTTSTTVEPTTSLAGDSLRLKVLNGSAIAVLGSRLMVAAQGSDDVTWKVQFQKKSHVFPFRYTVVSNVLTLQASATGSYLVQASDKTSSNKTAEIILKFYYPITKVKIWRPRVAGVNRSFNTTAFVSAKNGLPDLSFIVGNVSFHWRSASKWEAFYGSKRRMLLIPKRTGVMSVFVRASNKIGVAVSTANVVVKEYIETLTIPIVTTFSLDNQILTYDWLETIRNLLAEQLLLKLYKDISLKSKFGLTVHIEPTLPLQVSLILAPLAPGIPTRQQLAQISNEIKTAIVHVDLVLDLAGNHHVNVTIRPKQIDCESKPCAHGTCVDLVHGYHCACDSGYSGTQCNLAQAAGLSPPSIIAIVVFFILIVIVALAMFRRYGRTRRWKSYFTTGGMNPSLRISHIVRPRAAGDHVPIVENDDYIDEELEDLESAVSPQDGTLQFQS